MSTSRCREICKKLFERTHKEKGRDFYSRCSIVAAAGVVPNSDPCQIITPLVLVGLGLGVWVGFGLGNQIASNNNVQHVENNVF